MLFWSTFVVGFFVPEFMWIAIGIGLAGVVRDND